MLSLDGAAVAAVFEVVVVESMIEDREQLEADAYTDNHNDEAHTVIDATGHVHVRR